MSEKKQVVVVTPLYKESLTPVEEQSFLNNVRVLKKYDYVCLCPEGLDVSFFKRIAPEVKYHFFRKHDFGSVKKYNRLLVAPRFYKAFSDYEYMLICHFDAWVFRDDLEAWCEVGYDYIGAPFTDRFYGKIANIFPSIANVCLGKVGNGGFCLRKISSHLQVLRRLWWLAPFYSLSEDVFWTLLPSRVMKLFRYPDFNEANRFAIEHEVQKCLDMLGGEVPFGCHGWFRKAPDIWPRYTKVAADGKVLQDAEIGSRS